MAWGLALSIGGIFPGPASGARVDLNGASVEELTELPGIGPARARAIIERREEEPFAAADDLLDVPGIGPSLVDQLREHVEADSSSGVDGDRAVGH